jgi:uncharacterized membrane protein YtjA (UPF0391 family)
MMHYYAAVYLIMALIAAVVGYGDLAAGFTEIARVLFVLFLVMAAVSYVVHLIGRR